MPEFIARAGLLVAMITALVLANNGSAEAQTGNPMMAPEWQVQLATWPPEVRLPTYHETTRYAETQRTAMAAMMAADPQGFDAAYSTLIDLMDATYGPDHPNTSLMKAMGAMEYVKIGLFPQAQQLAEQARRSAESRFDLAHELVLTARAAEAHAFGALGNFDRANAEFETLEELLKAPAAERYDYRTSLHIRSLQATALIASNRHEKGRAILHDILQEMEDMLSADSPVLLGALEPLVGSYMTTGEFHRAIPLLERVVRMHEIANGPSSRPALQAKAALANSLVKLPDETDRTRATSLSTDVVTRTEAAGLPRLVVARTQIGHAHILTQSGQIEEAADVFHDGLAGLEAELPAGTFEIFLAETGYAFALQHSGRADEAQAMLEASHESLAASLPDGNPLRIQSHLRMANFYRSRENQTGALRHIEDGLALLTHDHDGQFDLFEAELLLVRVSADTFTAAEKIADLETIRHLLAPNPTPMARNSHIWATLLLASEYVQGGRADEGEILVEEAMARMADGDSRRGFGLSVLGMIANLRGDSLAARRLNMQLLELQDRATAFGGRDMVSDQVFAASQVQFLNTQAMLLASTGDFDAAFDVLDQAEMLADTWTPMLQMDRLATINTKGFLHLGNGDFERGRNALQEILGVYKSDTPPDNLIWLASVGLTALTFGQYDLIDDTLDIQEAVYPDLTGENESDFAFYMLDAMISVANEDLGSAAEALRHIPRDHPFWPQLEFISRAVNAAELAIEWQHEEAYSLLRRDVTLIDTSSATGSLQSGLQVRELNRNRRAMMAPILLGSGHQLAGSASPERGPNYVDDAIRAVQISGLQKAGIAFEQGLLRSTAAGKNIRDEYERMGELERRIAQLDADIVSRLGRSVDEGHLAALSNERQEALTEYRKTGEAIYSALPMLSEMMRDEAVDLDELQSSILREDEALIIIHASGRIPQENEDSDIRDLFRDHVLIVTTEETAWVRVDTSFYDIAYDVIALQSAFATAAGQLRSGPVDGSSTAVGFPVDVAARLYQALFAKPEAQNILSSRTDWTIVPSGIYASIPYPALVSTEDVDTAGDMADPDALRALDWLGLQRNIAIAPSVLSLKYARGRAAEGGARPTAPFFGIGAPAFDGAADAEIAALEVYQRSGRGNLSAIRELRPLPHTAIEIRTLARELGAPSGAFLLDEEATEAELRRFNRTGELARARVIAFATHGLLAGEDRFSTDEPALALTPPRLSDEAQVDPDNDGLLTASEAATLNLRAEWVILSACNTAASGQAGSEELSGLASGFLAAGAQSLLVSHYPVYDHAAALLSIRAVTYSEAPGTRRSAALRQSMSDLMADTSRDHTALSNAHPSIWAPFILIDPY